MIVRGLLLLVLGGALGLGHAALRPVVLDFEPVPTAPARGLSQETGPPNALLGLDAARLLHEDPGVVFFDASSLDDYARGHIPGSLHLSPDHVAAGAWPECLDTISRGATIVVYCSSARCDAATMVALRIREFGFTSVSVFPDGLEAWKAAQYPLETGR